MEEQFLDVFVFESTAKFLDIANLDLQIKLSMITGNPFP
jgi:hypothetical protein